MLSSWSLGSKSSLFDEKLSQIKDLKSSFPQLQERTQNEFYELRDVNVLDVKTTTMKIYLNAEFPSKGPIICVDKDLSSIHQWVDGEGHIIGCDQLKNWQYKKSSLVNIITTIKNALQNGMYGTPVFISGGKSIQSRTIPQVGLPAISGTQNSTSNSMSVYPAVAHYNNKKISTNAVALTTDVINNNNNNNNNTNNNNKSNNNASFAVSSTSLNEEVQPPDIPASFPFLNTLEVTQLKRFVISCKEFDQKTFDSHINDDKGMISIKSFKNDIMKNNFDLCTSNIKLEDKLLENYDILQTLKSELQDLLDQYQDRVNDVKKKGNKSESHIRQKLNEKLQVYDQLANSISTNFFECVPLSDTPTVSISAIMREYLDSRKKYYALRSKLDAIKYCV